MCAADDPPSTIHAAVSEEGVCFHSAEATHDSALRCGYAKNPETVRVKLTTTAKFYGDHNSRGSEASKWMSQALDAVKCRNCA
jgi:hypothetical protein